MKKLLIIGFGAVLAAPVVASQIKVQPPITTVPAPQQGTVKAPPIALPDSVLTRIDPERNETCKALEPVMGKIWFPGFDWSTPKRYGNDRAFYRDEDGNPVGNGIVDLPNTLDYVMNRVSYSDNASDACPCKPEEDGRCEPRFRINFDLEGTQRASWRQVASTLRNARARENCPALDFPDQPEATFLFEIDGEDVSVGRNGQASVCLTEGHHPVTLRMDYGEESRAVTRQIEVIDHLIVNIGDSYGAGEGTPETNARPRKMGKYDFFGNLSQPVNVNWKDNHIAEIPFFAQWADPGIPIPMTTRSVQAFSDLHKAGWDAGVNARSHPILIAKQSEKTYQGDITLPDWQTIKDEFYGLGSTISDARRAEYHVLMDHHHAHRSSANGSSQLALHLEYHDEKSSVTYINLAASGATIDIGLIHRYNGVFELKSATTGRAYLPQDRGQIGLTPQLDEFKDLMGSRSADHIYLSVGGNDAGFANIINIFMGAWNFGGDGIDGNVRTMLGLFKSGKWKNSEFGGLLGWANLKFDDIAGLNGLVEEYRKVHERLISLYKRGQFRGDVTLVGYPDFSTSTRTDMDPKLRDSASSNPDRYFCDIKVTDVEDASLRDPIRIHADFDPHEFRTAKNDVSAPLERKMSEAVAAMNKGQNLFDWKLLLQGDAPGLHGICGWGQYDRFDFARRYGTYRTRHHFGGTSLTNTTADDPGFAWYRSPAAGAATQRGMAVTNTGLFHPNEFGYRHVGRLMLQDLDFYGAEFTETAFIASKPGFIDINDSILEVSRSGSQFVRGEFSSALAGSHDVEIFELPLFNKRCSPHTIELTGSKGVEDLVVTVFGRNGEVIASSSPDLKPTPARTGATILGSETVGITLPKGLRTTIDEPDLAQFVRDDDFCAATFHSQLASAIEDHGPSDRLSFMAGYYGIAYIAISHGDNLDFDPVTGRGDNREELDRPAVSFRGRVYAAGE